jgi:aminoglycoside phosphotransferase (APT) family kinase protein
MASNSIEKAAWKVVSPPPELPLSAADALLSNWRAANRVVSIEPLAGGLMNWNYAIRLSGSPERFVLRFYDRAPETGVREVRILELVGADLPVPRVFHWDVTGAEGYPPFCVLEFIEGISLRELLRREDVKGVGEASYDAGRLVARLTKFRFPHTGLLSSSLKVQDGPFADVGLAEMTGQIVASPVFRDRVGGSLLAQILGFVRTHNDKVPGPGAGATLAHGDFNAPNIFVREERGTWRVAAILDWEYAFAGSILCDIGNMLRYERRAHPRYEPHFSLGLRDGGWSAPDDWLLRARLADLPALCDLLTRDDVPDTVVAELHDLIERAISLPGG